jgi:hypothetical protein
MDNLEILDIDYQAIYFFIAQKNQFVKYFICI